MTTQLCIDNVVYEFVDSVSGDVGIGQDTEAYSIVSN